MLLLTIVSNSITVSPVLCQKAYGIYMWWVSAAIQSHYKQWKISPVEVGVFNTSKSSWMIENNITISSGGMIFHSKAVCTTHRGPTMMQQKQQGEFSYLHIHTNKRGHEVRSFSNIYQCASVFPVITPSNINAYRFSHCVFISFNYVQLIISILWNRWCPHFSNFLLGVHGIFSHLDLFVFTRWRVGPITLTRSDFTCLQWVQASPPWPQHSADVALCFLLQQDDKSCNSSVLFKITFICGTNDVFCRLLVALNRCSWRKAEKWILCSQRKVTLNK